MPNSLQGTLTPAFNHGKQTAQFLMDSGIYLRGTEGASQSSFRGVIPNGNTSRLQLRPHLSKYLSIFGSK